MYQIKIMGLAGLCVSLITPCVSAAVQGQSFSHGDWELSCDNTGTCRAAGYQSDDDFENMVSVLLTRKAGAGTPVLGEFAMTVDDEKTVIPKQYTLKINGQSYGKVLNDRDDTTVLNPQQVQALIKSAKANTKIVFDAGKNSRVLSDQGLSAVLLKMDEFQKRIGTPSALIKKGNKSEQNVLKAVPMPVVVHQAAIKGKKTEYKLQSAEAKRIQSVLKSSTHEDNCPILFGGESFESDRLTVTPLTQDKSLVTSPCWSGAYNFGSGAWVVNRELTKVLQMVSESVSEDETTVLYANHKGRGIGDCWSMESWVWNGQRFVQILDATTGMCKGFAGGAWNLPTVIAEVEGLAR